MIADNREPVGMVRPADWRLKKMKTRSNFADASEPDPEIRTLNGGGKVATFRLTLPPKKAGCRTASAKKRTTWHTVETFRPADIKVVEDTVRKGDLIRVDGTLRTEDYTDRDGVKRYATKVVTSEWEHGIYADPRGDTRREAGDEG